MPLDILKTILQVHLNIGDLSFEGVVEQYDKDGLIKIKAPVQWRNGIRNLDNNCDCILTCKSEEGGYRRFKMLLEDKQIDSVFPMVLLRPSAKVEEQPELRKLKQRVEIFVFTEASRGDCARTEMAESGPYIAIITNISLNGCMLMSQYEYKVDDFLWLYFGLSDDAHVPLTVRCQVRNKRQAPIENSSYYGLEFIEMEAAEEKKIRSFIEGER